MAAVRAVACGTFSPSSASVRAIGPGLVQRLERRPVRGARHIAVRGRGDGKLPARSKATALMTEVPRRS